MTQKKRTDSANRGRGRGRGQIGNEKTRQRFVSLSHIPPRRGDILDASQRRRTVTDVRICSRGDGERKSEERTDMDEIHSDCNDIGINQKTQSRTAEKFFAVEVVVGLCYMYDLYDCSALVRVSYSVHSPKPYPFLRSQRGRHAKRRPLVKNNKSKRRAPTSTKRRIQSIRFRSPDAESESG